MEGGIPKRGKRARGALKGRAVDAAPLAEVQALLAAAQRKSGTDPRRRDLLIENLHLIQDRYGHISAAHMVALAREMKLAMTEVYEVATFYHHFDMVKALVLDLHVLPQLIAVETGSEPIVGAVAVRPLARRSAST